MLAERRSADAQRGRNCVVAHASSLENPHLLAVLLGRGIRPATAVFVSGHAVDFLRVKKKYSAEGDVGQETLGSADIYLPPGPIRPGLCPSVRVRLLGRS